ncbi:hypothetical protein B0H67DRAFT_550280 [Lasiosphaeris hirsuta]|uniref:Uncharacterized protein n=1 Tax=Lasiosphaeris hirsuta TaxID=260670 RepID=A0AA40E5C7_9PEZI|nr:hypothetical protein B0H67DRAFT_550280 [Lasiosphaeris hirsuta]
MCSYELEKQICRRCRAFVASEPVKWKGCKIETCCRQKRRQTTKRFVSADECERCTLENELLDEEELAALALIKAGGNMDMDQRSDEDFFCPCCCTGDSEDDIENDTGYEADYDTDMGFGWGSGFFGWDSTLGWDSKDDIDEAVEEKHTGSKDGIIVGSEETTGDKDDGYEAEIDDSDSE